MGIRVDFKFTERYNKKIIVIYLGGNVLSTRKNSMQKGKVKRRIIIATLVVVLIIAGIMIDGFIHKDTQAASSRVSGKIEDIFPKSYHAALNALKAKHPNWQFVAFNTGLTWDECFETNKAEMVPGRNLIQLSQKTSSWRSTTVSGSFSWSTNQWEVKSAPNWVQASEEAIKYTMDPRNFLNEEQIFQFEQLSYASYHTVEGVEKLIKNSFMAASKGESIVNNEGKSLTYAEAFVEIGKKLNVSPFMLASRVFQEQGTNGTSKLISGDFTVNGTRYTGYYNYFNIQASGKTTEEILQNGINEAISAGWNTRYKALYGGAEKLTKSYISRGQDTVYLQKYNVDSSSNRLFWGQYMQNILAPYAEGVRVKKTYTSMDGLDNPFVFVIPVFKDMPEQPCPEPTVDGNPNYKLASIIVDNESVSGFSMDKLEYSMTVPYSKSSVSISAVAYASSLTGSANTTSINGSMGTYVGTHKLNVGNNRIELKSTAENGTSVTYVINITRESGISVDGGSISVDEYTVSDTTITGIQPETTVQTLAGKVKVTGSLKVQIVDSKGAVVSNDKAVATGMKVQILSGTTVSKEYTVIIYGDVNGDGKISLLDYVGIERHILGWAVKTGNYLTAADANKDGKVSLLDYVAVERHILGWKKITQ